MGIFQYVDSQTGKGYDFTISGENPSDAEFAKIAQILQRDREEDAKHTKIGMAQTYTWMTALH